MCDLAQYLEDELNKYWLENKKRKRTLAAAVAVAPCLVFQGMALQPPSVSSQPPVGEREERRGLGACSHPEKIVQGLGDDCVPRPPTGEGTQQVNGKSQAPLLTAFIIQNFSQPGGC